MRTISGDVMEPLKKQQDANCRLYDTHAFANPNPNQPTPPSISGINAIEYTHRVMEGPVQPVSPLPSPGLASEMQSMIATFMDQGGFLRWLVAKPWSSAQLNNGKLKLTDQQLAAFLTDYLAERLNEEIEIRVAEQRL